MHMSSRITVPAYLEYQFRVTLDRAGSDKVKLALGNLDDGFLGAVAKDKFTDWWYRLVSSQQPWAVGEGQRNREEKHGKPSSTYGFGA
jgi:hypothetical protein